MVFSSIFAKWSIIPFWSYTIVPVILPRYLIIRMRAFELFVFRMGFKNAIAKRSSFVFGSLLPRRIRKGLIAYSPFLFRVFIKSGCTFSVSINNFPYQPEGSKSPSVGWPVIISNPFWRHRSAFGAVLAFETQTLAKFEVKNLRPLGAASYSVQATQP